MSLINAERLLNRIQKRMTEAEEQKRNHAYIKGLRDAAKDVFELLDEETSGKDADAGGQ